MFCVVRYCQKKSFLPSSCYLGLSIAGGKGAAANRIFVVDVKKGGPAEKNGQIQQADEILEVNDVTIRGLTHYEASAILKVSFVQPSDNLRKLGMKRVCTYVQK